MPILEIEAELEIPYIYCNAEKGIIEIKGKSTYEDPIEIYQSLLDWLDEYAKTPHKHTDVNIHLEYFNTSSSKCLLDAFKILELIHQDKASVVINWFYKSDDDDLEEAGMDYSDLIKIPVKLIKI
ncbi:MAG: DUF1987 domain-containing protein [Chlorobi bacterium]|nr:DUF1987 domain-containing protein [Chlorobiota bacterium]